MSTALYRRYRSQRFADLVGQDVIATTLRNEVRAGALAHAYLFTGIRGTGKTSTARILARGVNCLALRDGEPCNECAACREILDGSAVDVLEIDAASNRGIDEMRDLRERVKYLPASLRTKVYIIDEAHMLTPEAWNAFLKTLEEPPAHVLFVLATTEPHKVPETVRSRVQRFDFRRVSAADVAGHLERIAAAEKVDAEPAALALLARAAQGSVRDSLSMLDQALAGGERPLGVAAARRALGAADPGTMRALMEALAGADGAGALRAVATAFDSGADPRQLLREASRLARAAEFAALGHLEGAAVEPDEAELAASLARVAPAGYWLRALAVLQATELELRQPVDARLQVEYCVMRLVADAGDAGVSLDALEARVRRLEAAASGVDTRPVTAQPAAGGARPRPAAASVAADRTSEPGGLRSGPAPPPGVQPVPAAVPGSASIDTAPGGGATAPAADAASVEWWEQHWSLLLEAVNRRDRALAGVLRDCRAIAADGATLTVGAPYNFHREKLREPSRLAELGAAASEVAGSPRTIETEYTGGEPAPRRPPGTGDATQAVLDTFAGSRVTSTRLREIADRPAGDGAA